MINETSKLFILDIPQNELYKLLNKRWIFKSRIIHCKIINPSPKCLRVFLSDPREEQWRGNRLAIYRYVDFRVFRNLPGTTRRPLPLISRYVSFVYFLILDETTTPMIARNAAAAGIITSSLVFMFRRKSFLVYCRGCFKIVLFDTSSLMDLLPSKPIFCESYTFWKFSRKVQSLNIRAFIGER